MKTIAIVGTFDTKGEESAFLRDLIAAAGFGTVTIDAGVLGGSPFVPDISRSETALAGGEMLESLLTRGDRGHAVETMARGAAVVVRRLFDAGRIHGVVALGGSAGTTIATAAMRALPVGVPKVMVSTLASGDTRPYVGTKDICMMYSVLDIAGLNAVSRTVIGNAAGAICGMAARPADAASSRRTTIAATMFGVTTPCVTAARRLLEARNFEVLVFHATGSGGRAMEELIADGMVQGVLDITSTELADELLGGVMSAGPARLEAAGARGIPQVVCPGAIDMVNFGPADTVPARYRGRQLHVHNATVTLMRTTPEECAEIGRRTVRKLNRATGPATVLIPLKGVSAIDIAGGPFYFPEALEAYRAAIARDAAPNVAVVELDLHINDPAFAQAAVASLLGSGRYAGRCETAGTPAAESH